MSSSFSSSLHPPRNRVGNHEIVIERMNECMHALQAQMSYLLWREVKGWGWL